ncbi:MAG TPA: ComF family protein [Candidatus Binataceae bacterium]|nr:ComF family protein [Candidatus Binataceae bacterium]
MAALAELIDFLYPPHCAACGVRFAPGTHRRVCPECIARAEALPEPLCAVCGGTVESVASGASRCARCIANPPHFRRARAVARYRASAEDDPRSLPAMLRRHKYGLDQAAGRALAEYLGDSPPIEAGAVNLIVPVPLHRGRLRWRGFNQAAILGEELSRRLKVPLDATALVRTRATAAQTSGDHDARRRNVRRAFAVARPDRIRARTILLVDDVMTTGATADECARVLLEAGAREVDVFTLARVL